MPDGDVRILFESRQHELFIGSDDFIYRLGVDGKPQLLRAHTSMVYTFIEDAADEHAPTIWISSFSGLYAYRKGALSPRPEDSARSVAVMGRDRENRIWAGTFNGLRRFEHGRFVSSWPASSVVHEFGAIAGDRDGNLWAGSQDSGLFRVTANRVSSFNSPDGLTDQGVLSLFEDREGGLWAGTAAGLDRFRDTSLSTFTVKENLPSDRVGSILQARDGAIYVFCQGGGLARFKDGVATQITRKDGLPNTYSSSMFESRDGSLWLGIDGNLTRYSNAKFTPYPVANGRFNVFISAIGEDDESLIVATSETVVHRLRDGRIRPFTIRGRSTPLSTPGNYTFTIYHDPAGTTWFGTVQGLFRFSPGEPPANARRKNVDFPVTTIFDDHKGSLWLGGRIPGLTRYRIRDGRVTRYTQNNGLFDDYPTCILTGADGNFWISTSSGIYAVSAKSLDDFADGRASAVQATRYGTAEGMKTSEASPPLTQPGGWRARDGRLWFGSAKGVVVVDPSHMVHNRLVPPVVVEEILADGKSVSKGFDVRLAPGTGRIEIHYASLSLLLPSHVRCKFRLEPYDRDWVEAGLRRVAFYTKLPPGHYRFRVIASNNDGVWNEEGAAIDFALLPHFYETAWFYILSGIALVLLAGGVYLLRIRYLIRGNEALEAKVALRTEELRNTAKALEIEKGELLLAREELERLATRDGLTGIWNRAAIFDLLTRTLARCARAGSPVSVIMCDLDEFKQINDRFGHPAGDLTLKEATRRLVAGLRTSDLVGRYGGEEFLIVLPDCDCAEARARADQLRHAIASRPIELAQAYVTVTCSFGVGGCRDGKYDVDRLIREADAALYRAKEAGKNGIGSAELHPGRTVPALDGASGTTGRL